MGAESPQARLKTLWRRPAWVQATPPPNPTPRIHMGISIAVIAAETAGSTTSGPGGVGPHACPPSCGAIAEAGVPDAAAI